MKKFLKAASLVLVFVLTATMFAACGGNGDNGDKSGDKVKLIDIALTEEKYAFAIDKDQPELLAATNALIAEIMADGTFDAICDKYFGNGEPTAVVSAAEDASKDQLVVATNAQFEPFEYKKGSNFYGIDMEIAALLAKKLNKELVIKDMDFDAVCLAVNTKKCDMAAAGLTVNEKRAEIINFTDSYYNASQKLIVKADDTTFDACKDAAAIEAVLNGFDATVKIGVQNGTTAQKYVEGDADWDFVGFKTTCAKFGSGSLAVQDMINGNVDYVIIDAAPAQFITAGVNAAA